MSTEQLHRTSLVISDLQRTLDVFEGLFVSNALADKLFEEFPEIGVSLQEAMVAKLLITSASIFSDAAEVCGKETLSLNNMDDKYGQFSSPTTRDLKSKILSLVAGMNLKGVRNGYISHLGLEIMLGNKKVQSHISVNKLRNLFDMAQQYFNCLGREAGLLNSKEFLSYYTPIPVDKSVAKLLSKLTGNA